MNLRRWAALYFGGHAILDLAWWAAVHNVGWFRGWFELDPANHRVLDAFIFPDTVLLFAISGLAAIGLVRGWRSALVLAALTTGGSAYVTLYLAGWVLQGGHGWMGVAAMTIETALMAVFVWLVGAQDVVGEDAVV